MGEIIEFTNTSTGRTGTIQEFTPQAGTWKITAYGAEGGKDQDGRSGGKGAKMSGIFDLDGSSLKILVGQRGVNGTSTAWHRAGGGGGGSFVWIDSSEELLIAAGGGMGNNRAGDSTHGTTTEGDGSGGSAGTTGAGGAGWNSNGSTGRSNHTGGTRPLSGGAGGNTANGSNALGGFGGGGAAANAGGGGGGYTGGVGANTSTGGGGSYNIGEEQDNESGVQEGHGLVLLEFLGGAFSMQYKHNGQILEITEGFYKKNGVWKPIASMGNKTSTGWKGFN